MRTAICRGPGTLRHTGVHRPGPLVHHLLQPTLPAPGSVEASLHPGLVPHGGIHGRPHDVCVRRAVGLHASAGLDERVS